MPTVGMTALARMDGSLGLVVHVLSLVGPHFCYYSSLPLLNTRQVFKTLPVIHYSHFPPHLQLHLWTLLIHSQSFFYLIFFIMSSLVTTHKRGPSTSFSHDPEPVLVKVHHLDPEAARRRLHHDLDSIPHKKIIKICCIGAGYVVWDPQFEATEMTPLTKHREAQHVR